MKTIKTDFRKAKLDSATRSMLEFVERVTVKAHEIQEDEVAALRQEGFTDEDILDMVHIAGYFNHINRLADALGVELEDFMVASKNNK
ncbi:MAG: carboxymuconolactone decarboxylase family protein [bacterium]